MEAQEKKKRKELKYQKGVSDSCRNSPLLTFELFPLPGQETTFEQSRNTKTELYKTSTLFSDTFHSFHSRRNQFYINNISAYLLKDTTHNNSTFYDTPPAELSLGNS